MVEIVRGVMVCVKSSIYDDVLEKWKEFGDIFYDCLSGELFRVLTKSSGKGLTEEPVFINSAMYQYDNTHSVKGGSLAKNSALKNIGLLTNCNVYSHEIKYAISMIVGVLTNKKVGVA